MHQERILYVDTYHYREEWHIVQRDVPDIRMFSHTVSKQVCLYFDSKHNYTWSNPMQNTS